VASQFKRQGIQTHITTKEKMIADMKEQIDRLQETLEAQKEETQHFQQLYEKEQSNKQVPKFPHAGHRNQTS
jgi:chromosome segregation ATPase